MTNKKSATPGGDPAAFRVGDADRNSAASALGEHMASGRLDLDEYGTRSAVASAARTAGELQALFADLPAPHPALPRAQQISARQVPGTLTTPKVAGGNVPSVTDDRSKAQKLVAAVSAGSAVIAVVLFFATGQWWWFLLIPLISSVAGSVWGDSWKRPDARR